AALRAEDLPALCDRAVDEYASFGSVPRAYLEEIVAWGGRRFDEATIVARFAGGTRGLETRYADHPTAGAPPGGGRTVRRVPHRWPVPRRDPGPRNPVRRPHHRRRHPAGAAHRRALPARPDP